VSDVRPDVDLGGLARPKQIPRPGGRWRRLILPGALLVGLTAVILWSLEGALRGSIEVSILRPEPVEGGATGGGIACQAAGWVEPDPFPLRVVPLTGGTIAEILVQESDVVESGEPVARLVAEDAELELEEARRARERALAEREEARVELDFAGQELEAAIDETEAVAVASAELAGSRAEGARLAAAAEKWRAESRVAAEEVAVQRHLEREGAAGPRQVELAQARLEAAEAVALAATGDSERAKSEVDAALARLERARRDSELRIEDRGRVERARAALEAAGAEAARAEAALARARLRMERTTVLSPWDGVVLELLAVPGAVAGGEGGAAICSLYDPDRLRVRVDVPQEEISRVSLGQEAEILSESRRGRPYAGRVVRRVPRADIQKVTLQVHVAVEEPDELLRPEMLCQVRFRSPSGAEASAGTRLDAVLLVPARLVDASGSLWVLDADGRTARRRAVECGARRGDGVEVLSGLNLSDKLIDPGGARLEEGARVRVSPTP